jgi:hypothetical protein
MRELKINASILLKGERVMNLDSGTSLLINNLASRYIANNDEAVFTSMYKTLANEMKLRLKYWSDTVYLAEPHDFISMFDDSVLKTINKLKADGNGEFINLFQTILMNDYRSFMRKLQTRRKYEDLDDGNGELMRITVVEDYETDLEIKTDADKRQLINALSENNDPLTTTIINEYLSGGLTRPTAIGKKLGIHHSKVTRQLQKLTKKYDESKFGDFHAYLVC